jgi:hypothetical protein
VLPPEVSGHSGANPAGTSESLCRRGRVKGAGEQDGEESEGSLGHTLLS